MVIRKAVLVWSVTLLQLGCAFLFPVSYDGKVLDFEIAIP